MKKYKLELQREDVYFEKTRSKASSYVSFEETINGFICNTGLFDTQETYYFDTLKELNKFIDMHPQKFVTVNEDNELSSEWQYSYAKFEFDKENKQYKQIWE